MLAGNKQDTETKSIILKPGYEYVIEVSMDGQESTNGFKELSLDQRKCKLNHEIDKSSKFKIYSKSTCKYNCHVTQSYKKCQCIPWDFIHDIDGASECDVFGRTCFYHEMEEMAHGEDNVCPQCLEDCDKIVYKTRVVSSENINLKSINGNQICNKYLCTEGDHSG